MMTKQKLKQCLTMTEMDNVPDSTLVARNDVSEFKFAKLCALANTNKLVVYTQVDAERGVIKYLRGWHYINRTGVYAFITRKVKK